MSTRSTRRLGYMPLGGDTDCGTEPIETGIAVSVALEDAQGLGSTLGRDETIERRDLVGLQIAIGVSYDSSGQGDVDFVAPHEMERGLGRKAHKEFRECIPRLRASEGHGFGPARRPDRRRGPRCRKIVIRRADDFGRAFVSCGIDHPQDDADPAIGRRARTKAPLPGRRRCGAPVPRSRHVQGLSARAHARPPRAAPGPCRWPPTRTRARRGRSVRRRQS